MSKKTEEKTGIKEWPEAIQQSLLKILKEIEEEDQYIRENIVREAKQHELYWHGFQYIFWDERAQDYRVPTHEALEEISTREETRYIYDYVVNTFKAHGLSIIAALSAEIPGVPFSPMDADSPEDSVAARKAEVIGKLIQKYNKSKLLFYEALFLLYTGHFVAAYNYYDRDENLGTVQIPKYERQDQKVTPDSYNCADCNFTSDVPLDDCPECSGKLNLLEGRTEKIPVKTGMEDIDRGMEKIKVKGSLTIKIPIYASDQAACGYLIEYTDQHYAWVRNKYKNLDRDKITPITSEGYEKTLRMPSFGGIRSDSYASNLITLKRVWLRSWMFDILPEDEAKVLHKEFPKGVAFVALDTAAPQLAEANKEKLDDHWTLAKGDLSRSSHGDPLGKPLVPLQDLENMVTNLLTESLEHSVPSTWADPEMVDFDLYSKQEVAPGAIYPSKTSLTNPNRKMDDYFYTMKTSTLPKEGVDFDKIIESKGQFVVGAFPSIFGGPQTQGSKTLGEYQESRGYALQRLSIPYQLLFFWWSDTIHKSVKDYIINMITDEKHTMQLEGDGKYESVQILQDTFVVGKFNLILSEAATDLPVSYSQKRTNLQQMIQLNNEFLNQFLFSPDNRKVTLKYLGMEELSDLDSNQTLKQLMEIEQLLREEPIESGEIDPISGQPVKTSSVPVEPDIDDPEIHLRVIKTFASSPSGQEHKKQNPAGYENMLLHAKEHKAAMMQEQIQQQALNPANAAPPAPASTNKGEEGTPQEEPMVGAP